MHAGPQYDVFLSHAGDRDPAGKPQEPVVKALLSFLRRALNALPAAEGRTGNIAAFLDEADMNRIGETRDILAAALLSAPIGT